MLEDRLTAVRVFPRGSVWRLLPITLVPTDIDALRYVASGDIGHSERLLVNSKPKITEICMTTVPNQLGLFFRSIAQGAVSAS